MAGSAILSPTALPSRPQYTLTATDVDELRYRLRRLADICESAARRDQAAAELIAAASTIDELHRLLDRVEYRQFGGLN